MRINVRYKFKKQRKNKKQTLTTLKTVTFKTANDTQQDRRRKRGEVF